ncbi:MAG TPA: hypothetical protein VH253_14020 [Phycisphaerae bacterium]|nr:hypothetical protein [Phycisphaerae bacterium]
MTTLPPAPQYSYEKDTGDLKTLSIFWYIIAALQALGGCIVVGWLLFVVLMGAGMASSGNSDDATAGAVFSGFFGCFGLFALALWWGLAFLNFVVARSLPQRKRRVLCFIMAIWICLWFPFGTILGIFTLIILNRPTVKAAAGLPVAVTP